mmetsp:Transcript_17985/g.49934  ORF Transcript_17985/g.49934 Transcript_17985/m.49934 type:complete len:235 (-) Transcript_17985:302-1006(-)
MLQSPHAARFCAQHHCRTVLARGFGSRSNGSSGGGSPRHVSLLYRNLGVQKPRRLERRPDLFGAPVDHFALKVFQCLPQWTVPAAVDPVEGPCQGQGIQQGLVGTLSLERRHGMGRVSQQGDGEVRRRRGRRCTGCLCGCDCSCVCSCACGRLCRPPRRGKIPRSENVPVVDGIPRDEIDGRRGEDLGNWGVPGATPAQGLFPEGCGSPPGQLQGLALVGHWEAELPHVFVVRF